MTQSKWKDPATYESLASATRVAAAGSVAGLTLIASPAADAYVGPGAGLGVLGILLAVVAAIFMALVGMVLWPIRLVAHRRTAKARAAETDRSADSVSPEGELRESPEDAREGSRAAK